MNRRPPKSPLFPSPPPSRSMKRLVAAVAVVGLSALSAAADDPKPPRAGKEPAPSLKVGDPAPALTVRDRKSTRLNSSHLVISYAVFCLKKKNKPQTSLYPRA